MKKAENTITTFNLLKRQAEKSAECAEKGLCIFAVRAVLKQCCNVSAGNEINVFYNLRAGLERDIKIRIKPITSGCKAYKTAYDKNGKRIRKTVSKSDEAALNSVAQESYSEAWALVNEAYLTYLEEKKNHALLDIMTLSPINWLDRPYTEKVLDKRIIIREQSAAWKEVEVKPIQKIYRAIRQAVRNTGAVKAASLQYTYIEELIKKAGEAAEAEAEAASSEATPFEIVYQRLAKYSDLGGEDKEGVYTADSWTLEEYNGLLEGLNLSKRQLEFINERVQGRGYKAIATKYGVKWPNVQWTLKRVQEKEAVKALYEEARQSRKADSLKPLEAVIAKGREEGEGKKKEKRADKIKTLYEAGKSISYIAKVLHTTEYTVQQALGLIIVKTEQWENGKVITYTL